MLVFVKMAFRNTLRQKRRSLLVASAIALGLGSMIVADGMMRGITRLMLSNATGSFMGEAQIHRRGFLEAQELDLSLKEGPDLATLVEEHPAVAATSRRLLGQVMLSSSYHAQGAILYGIDPDAESQVSRLEAALQAGEGQYLQKGQGKGILIGHKMAAELGVGLGDRLVVTSPQSRGQGVAQAMFRVQGVFVFGDRNFDKGVAFVTRPAFENLTDLKGSWHELAVQFKKKPGLEPEGVQAFFQQDFPPDWEVLSWRQLMPSLEALFEMTDLSMFIMAAILFAVIALSVINTLFQALYERSFEFGVMRAVGTRPVHMAALILMEALALAILSIPIGLALGLGLNSILAHYGMDYAGAEFAGIAFNSRMYSEIAWPQFTLFPFATMCLTLLAAIYPAVHAARINPAEALHKSL